MLEGMKALFHVGNFSSFIEAEQATKFLKTSAISELMKKTITGLEKLTRREKHKIKHLFEDLQHK